MIGMEQAKIESEIDYTELQKYFNELGIKFTEKANEILKACRLEHLRADKDKLLIEE